MSLSTPRASASPPSGRPPSAASSPATWCASPRFRHCCCATALRNGDEGAGQLIRVGLACALTRAPNALYQVWALEKFGIAPKGSSEVSSFLETGADALVEGGKYVIILQMSSNAAFERPPIQWLLVHVLCHHWKSVRQCTARSLLLIIAVVACFNVGASCSRPCTSSWQGSPSNEMDLICQESLWSMTHLVLHFYEALVLRAPCFGLYSRDVLFPHAGGCYSFL